MVLLLFVCVWQPAALRAQLKLGGNPASISKSSLLELESSRQGLLLPRVPDTLVTTLAAAPDGTILYYMPLSSILVRKGGAWRQMTDASTPVPTTGWLLNGNTLASTSTLGPVNNFALPFITNNQERMRIAATGEVGIGTTAPSTQLHVRTGTANEGGLRLENLTSASPATVGAGALGVDGMGKVVRAPSSPVIYSGSGTTAVLDAVTKVWVAEVQNAANATTGLQTITIPTNVIFTNILNIQVTAKGGSSITTTPVVSVVSNTNTAITIRVLESNSTLLIAEGLGAHSDVNTRIYIKVEGN
ncbi:hypothetical protein EG028_17230 [Chitinophaga barathri]|uniref:Uncharacterized protein n=2 Tax=Chitinophaga barathri TaxID=1647451 RepID=A0A3N4MIH8_9BACT|nr:hypothetical protein EG028_17230 [Chitinophaga barathri]